MDHVFKVRPPHTRRRNIPQDRQDEIRTALKKARQTFKALKRESYRLYLGRWTDVEWTDINRRQQMLREELDRYLAELRGHGPAELIDRCINIWNGLGIIRIHLEDAKSDRAKTAL